MRVSDFPHVEEKGGLVVAVCRQPASTLASLSATLVPSMFLLPATRARWAVSLLIGLITAAIGLAFLFSGSPICQRVRQSSYDTLHMIGGGRTLSTGDVVIVYLDLQSYNDLHLDPSRLWPRDLHAKLVNRLTAAGAKAVVFDIIFSSAGPTSQADYALAAAIHSNGKVILAGEYTDQISHASSDALAHSRLHHWDPPYEPFAKAAAGWGFAEQRIDDDFVVRNYLAGFAADQMPSLTWAAGTWLKLGACAPDGAIEQANTHWVRYYGAALSIPHCSYVQALAAADIPDDFFRDKVVFIGGRNVVGTAHNRQDEFRTPFRYWQSPDLFMPGVEVNAVEMQNLIRRDWLVRSAAEPWIIFAMAILAFLVAWLRPVHAFIVSVAAALFCVALSKFEFDHGTWFPWLIVAGLQIPTGFGSCVLFYTAEWWKARKTYELAKKAAEARIRQQAELIDKARDAILVQDLNGKFLYANPSVERIYGWTPQELQRPETADQLFAPEAAKASDARKDAIALGEWNGELSQRNKKGETVIVASRWTLIDNEAGEKVLLQINTDITAQKQLEAQFLRTQRLNTIGSLAGGIAHDLNNALSPILMGVQLMKKRNADEESQRLLELMETNTYRSAEMVRQVLLFARGRAGDLEPLDLEPLFREMEKLIRETFPQNISVETYLPRDLWQISAQPTQMHQLLLNLSVNARDAMPEGGKLTFVADNVTVTEKEAAATPNAKTGDHVCISVSDTGTGMSPEVKARIFEPFFTTKAEGKGTGIGLATVFRIIQNHHGFIRVESEPGEGTTFEVFIPRSVSSARETAAQQPIDAPHGNGEFILVADDEQAIRDIVADNLRAHGYKVISVANGNEAVEAFQRHASDVSLLFTDNAMPGKTGEQAIAEIRKVRPDLPVILASAEKQVANGEASRRILLLGKPFSLAEMLAAIHQILPRSKQEKST